MSNVVKVFQCGTIFCIKMKQDKIQKRLGLAHNILYYRCLCFMAQRLAKQSRNKQKHLILNIMKSLILGVFFMASVIGANATETNKSGDSVRNQIENQMASPKLADNAIKTASARVFFTIDTSGAINVLEVVSGQEYVESYLLKQLSGMQLEADNSLIGKVLSMDFSFRVE